MPKAETDEHAANQPRIPDMGQHEEAKRQIVEAKTDDDRQAAIENAMAAGIPLREIEELLDRLENLRNNER